MAANMDTFNALRGAALRGPDKLGSFCAGLLEGRSEHELADRAAELPHAHWRNATVTALAARSRGGLELLEREARYARIAETVSDTQRAQAASAWLAMVAGLRSDLEVLDHPADSYHARPDAEMLALSALCDPDRCAELAERVVLIGSQVAGAGPAWLRSYLSLKPGALGSLTEARRDLARILRAPLPDGRPVPAVRQILRPEAMRQFISAYADRPGWAGLRLGRMDKPTAMAQNSRPTAVWASAGAGGELEGRPFTWVVSCPLGITRARTFPSVTAAFSEKLTEILPPGSPPLQRGIETISRPFGAIDAPPAGWDAGDGDAGGWPLETFCRHAGAQWARALVWSRLWCPECGSELACVPLHRFRPEDVGVWRDARGQDYLKLAGLEAAGRLAPAPQRLSALEGFDDPPPRDPAHYALEPAPAVRNSSLQQALTARRR